MKHFISCITLLLFISCMEISAAVTTGSWTCDAESFNFLDGDGIVRKWRANNPMGGYTDYIQYESGRLETFNVTTCVWCYGKKICAICFGMGGQMIMGYWYPCKSCLGTRVCQNCKGAGCTTFHNIIEKDGTGIGYDQNGHVISRGVGSSNSSSGSSSKSSSKSSSSCSRCHGTGVNPSPNSGGSLSSWVAYYNTEGVSCPYCERRSSHYHDRCSSCNIPRY